MQIFFLNVCVYSRNISFDSRVEVWHVKAEQSQINLTEGIKKQPNNKNKSQILKNHW